MALRLAVALGYLSMIPFYVIAMTLAIVYDGVYHAIAVVIRDEAAR